MMESPRAYTALLDLQSRLSLPVDTKMTRNGEKPNKQLNNQTETLVLNQSLDSESWNQQNWTRLIPMI